MTRLRLWLPVVAFAAVIWTFSTGSFSGEHTSRILLPLLHWLFPYAPPATLDLIHLGIRKSGHVAEYFIFGLLLLRAVRAGRAWEPRFAVVALLLAALYATSDEMHQIFVPGRTPAVHDVLIDVAGAGLAQIVAWRWLCSPRAPSGARTRARG